MCKFTFQIKKPNFNPHKSIKSYRKKMCVVRNATKENTSANATHNIYIRKTKKCSSTLYMGRCYVNIYTMCVAYTILLA